MLYCSCSGICPCCPSIRASCRCPHDSRPLTWCFRSIEFRCATGESWQAVMLACKGGVDCQPHSPYRSSSSIVMPHTSSTTMTMAQMKNLSQQTKCGSDFAYLYFCSFVFLSSFLVGDEKSTCSVEFSADLDAESLRCRHHGQLRLSHAWFVDLRRTSSRWISAGLVGVRSRWNVCSFECPCLHRIDSLSHRGHLEFTKMFEMLRLMSPPVGFGTKCPSKLAYKVRSSTTSSSRELSSKCHRLGLNDYIMSFCF